MIFALAVLSVLLAINVDVYDAIVKIPRTKRSFVTKYHDTLLDHFSYRATPATFKLRYLISQTHWRPGNPILFVCGNEASVETCSDNSGFVWQLAPQMAAMVVFAEHRYYGRSLPFGNLSFSTPEMASYLCSEQALADFASLIVHLRGLVVGGDRSPVVAFGGSYGGMLAAWLRQKYPNIVAGALSSSAPILMLGNITHCNEAYQVVTKAFAVQGGEMCTVNIRRLWPLLKSFTTEDDLVNLSKTFRTCQPLRKNVQLMSLISRAIFEIAVANYPYPFNLTAPMPAWPIKTFCKQLTIEISDPQELLQAAFASIQVFFNATGQTRCIPFQSSDSSDNTAWMFQTCTELPLPMCTDGVTDMFYKDEYSKDLHERQCEAKFKVRPRWGWAQTIFWGGRLKPASNIIFSNGLHDPWSAGGIFSTNSASISIMTIVDGAHHIDLMEDHHLDPPGLRLVRYRQGEIIRKWINEWRK